MAENEKLSSFKLDSLIDIYKKYVNDYKNNERDNLEFEIRFGTAQSYRVNQTMFTNTYTYLTNMGFVVENSNYMLQKMNQFFVQSQLRKYNNNHKDSHYQEGYFDQHFPKYVSVFQR